MSIPFPVHIPFADTLGLRLHSCGAGQAELRIALVEAHSNSWHVAHGGLLMSLLDMAMAQAARTAGHDDPGDGLGMATIEMKTSFMRPATGELRAVGKTLHRTRATAFCEGSVLNDAGELCAHATGTYKYLRPRADAPQAAPTPQETP